MPPIKVKPPVTPVEAMQYTADTRAELFGWLVQKDIGFSYTPEGGTLVGSTRQFWVKGELWLKPKDHDRIHVPAHAWLVVSGAHVEVVDAEEFDELWEPITELPNGNREWLVKGMPDRAYRPGGPLVKMQSPEEGLHIMQRREGVEEDLITDVHLPEEDEKESEDFTWEDRHGIWVKRHKDGSAEVMPPGFNPDAE